MTLVSLKPHRTLRGFGTLVFLTCVFSLLVLVQSSWAAAPTVTNVAPATGSTAGGLAVTVTGTGFTGATEVDFGAAAVTLASPNVSDTSITVTSPAHAAGAVDVTVVAPGGTSAANPPGDTFTYAAPPPPAPTVTGINPATGPVAGGTSVIITGTGFTAGATVDFGMLSATFVFNSATQITATAPAASAAGAVDVLVTTGGGTSAATNADKFTYVAAPTITNVNPGNGPASGGTTVTITGTNLGGETAVKFGGVSATVTADSAGSITATSPAGGAGAVDVSVTTAGGTGTDSNAFTYVAAPNVTGVNPAAGPTGGGTTVTITGTGLAGETAVRFGGVSATVTADSAGSITATSPPSPAGVAGAADVTVTTAGGTATDGGAFTYVAQPTVTRVNPAAGPTGAATTVTITGTHLDGATAVKFGGATATVSADSAGSITATAPGGAAGAVDVTVTTAGGTATASGAFTYYAPPTVTGVTPANGPTAGGTGVTITGTNLTGATAVNVGGNGAFYTVVSNTQITAFTPAGATGAADVTVTTPGGTSTVGNGDKFTYVSIPTVTGVSPITGRLAGGTTVTITGTGFSGATAVSFGGTNAPGFTVNSGTQITVNSPGVATAGPVDITVTTAGGTSAANNADKFTYAPIPQITGVAPGAGPLAGGTAVTITGTGFTGATAVAFGSTAGANLAVKSSTQITVTSPAEAAGAVNVTVTTPGGTSPGNGTTAAFTYTAGPIVASVTPSAGPLGGGTSVTITGTDLLGTNSVEFGSVAATSVDVVSATEITATAPAESAATVAVKATNSGGTSPTTGTGDDFAYDPVPTVTGVSPVGGPLAGGTSIRITGTGLSSATAVHFGSKLAASFAASSNGLIIALSPSATAGRVDVTVTTPGGVSASRASQSFTYAEPPGLSGFSATAVSVDGAELNAKVDANGLPLSSCHFEYGVTLHYGGVATCGKPVAAGSDAELVSSVLTRLQPGTTYHYRVITTTLSGTSKGLDETFSTPQLQVVVAPSVGLLIERVEHHRGAIGKLLGIHGITQASKGETIRVRCVAGCSRHHELKQLLELPRLTAAQMRSEIVLRTALFLSTATRIEIDVSDRGRLSRYARYSFTVAAGASLSVHLTMSGCLSARGATVRCP